MWYLFFQIWSWILLAFFLGWVGHWFYSKRLKSRHPDISYRVQANPNRKSDKKKKDPDEEQSD